ncbi:MAG: rRNA pseudouridine synthase [Proteobacteria bacterium]|nr:rRNA pseudouridine synthase [Pseudomonadota bacterium]MBS0595969.1 rRNA pseudouridine synthase [Pseudomonadota bacterium]
MPDADAEGSGAAEAEPKPVRRRRTPKAEAAAANVEAAPSAATLPEVPNPFQAPGAEEAPAPKPRRRRTTAKAAEAPAAESSPDAPVEPAAAPADAGVAPFAAVTPEADAGSAAAPAAEPPEPANDEPSPTPPVMRADEAEEASAPSDDEQRPGRRRNRRDRRERREQAEAAAANGGTTGAAVPKPEAGALFAQVLSGEFDVEDAAPAPVADPAAAGDTAAAEPAAPPKRVLQPEPDAPKLHKVLAQSGIGSRRDMEDLIVDGHVTVNGEVAHVGQRVSFGDQVKVHGKPVKLRIMAPMPRIIAYHKPVGEIVTNDDPQNRPTVFRRLPRLPQGKWQSVGRLDINTEGLLLFTNSGELANQLMHPRFGVEREYAVRVLGSLTEEDKAELLAGVDVDGQKASFRSVEDGGGDGANHWYRVVITEGRNREVRKLFECVGLMVSRLIRIRYGTVVLPLGLKRGVWVDLDDNDVRAIRRLASSPQPQPRGGGDESPRGPRPERGGGRPNERGRPPRRPDGLPGLEGQGDAPRERAEQDPDADLDFDPSSIPNPLEQTFDKRFVQNPRTPFGGRGFGRGGGGFGAGGSAPAPSKPQRGPGPKQPDPLQTSLGYFGADAFHRKNRGGGGGGNKGGGGGRGFGGGKRGR